MISQYFNKLADYPLSKRTTYRGDESVRGHLTKRSSDSFEIALLIL